MELLNIGETLLITAAVFGVIKIIFNFLGWYASDDGDTVVRSRLDQIWLKLESVSIFEGVHSVFSRTVNKVEKIIKQTPNFTSKLILVLTLLSIASLYISLMGVSYRDGDFEVIDLFNSLFDPEFMSIFVVTIPFCVLIEMISISVTWMLLKRASTLLSLRKICIHILAEVSLAIILGFLIICVLSIPDSIRSLDLESLKELLLDIADSAIMYLSEDFWSEQTLNILIASAGLMLSTLLPSVAYLLVLILCFLGMVTPKSFHVFITRCIYLVTTENTPVFKLAGNFFGAMAVLLIAFSKLI